jgi:hypothetical protein
MKITLAKHGGLAAGIRQLPRVVNSSALPEKAVAELAGLIAAAKAEPPPVDDKPGRARDAMSYTITVEEAETGEPIVLRESDAGMTSSFAALLDWIHDQSSGK